MKSQTPTWAIIIAILMMLIGGCGIKNDLQSIHIRSVLALKDKIFDNIIEKQDPSVTEADSGEMDQDTLPGNDVKVTINSDSTTSPDSMDEKNNAELIKMKDTFSKMADIPEDVIQRIIQLGYVSLIFSVLFIIGGIFLLVRRPFSIQLVYLALGANIIFSMVRWIMLSGKGGSMLAIANSVGSASSIFASVVLIAVVVSCDKSHYEDKYSD
ncbi:MAG: hypothetical protein IPN89_00680 [Saprospiraceae bacterium]|nr:hypothetical protein [Saprospiraceae bacterium]